MKNIQIVPSSTNMLECKVNSSSQPAQDAAHIEGPQVKPAKLHIDATITTPVPVDRTIKPLPFLELAEESFWESITIHPNESAPQYSPPSVEIMNHEYSYKVENKTGQDSFPFVSSNPTKQYGASRVGHLSAIEQRGDYRVALDPIEQTRVNSSTGKVAAKSTGQKLTAKTLPTESLTFDSILRASPSRPVEAFGHASNATSSQKPNLGPAYVQQQLPRKRPAPVPLVLPAKHPKGLTPSVQRSTTSALWRPPLVMPWFPPPPQFVRDQNGSMFLDGNDKENPPSQSDADKNGLTLHPQAASSPQMLFTSCETYSDKSNTEAVVGKSQGQVIHWDDLFQSLSNTQSPDSELQAPGRSETKRVGTGGSKGIDTPDLAVGHTTTAANDDFIASYRPPSSNDTWRLFSNSEFAEDTKLVTRARRRSLRPNSATELVEIPYHLNEDTGPAQISEGLGFADDSKYEEAWRIFSDAELEAEAMFFDGGLADYIDPFSVKINEGTRSLSRISQRIDITQAKKIIDAGHYAAV